RCGPAGSEEGNVTSAMDRARSTGSGVRDTSVPASSARLASSPVWSSKRPPVRAGQGVPVAASSAGAAGNGGIGDDGGDGDGAGRTPSRQGGLGFTATPPTSTA
ncbi:unnamed protein product, partial [Laminaria digitata]